MGSLPGLDYEVGCGTPGRPSRGCSFCGRGGMLLTKGDASVCESCSHLVYLAWRNEPGEAPPDLPGEARRVSTVAVLVARRREVRRLDAPPGAPDDEKKVRAPRVLSSSYEFLLARQHPASPEGTVFLPPMAVCDGDVVKAAGLALSSVHASSWPALLEPLFTSYTPRGRLMAVVLALGWSGSAETEADCEWRGWPVSSHAGAMSGFYQAVETVWPLRLHKHDAQQEREELSVRVRTAARLYVELQSSLRAGTTTDSSMLAVYRAAMSEDELAVAAVVRKAEEEEREAESLTRQPHPTTPAHPAKSTGTAGPASGEEGGEKDEEGVGGGGGGEGDATKKPEPGFAR